MLTIKLPFKTDQISLDLINEMRKCQSMIVRHSFNRFKEGCSEKDIRHMTSKLNGISLIDSWFVQCGIKEANYVYTRFGQSKVIFGGKLNWKNYIYGRITKDVFKKNRLLPLCVQGEVCKKGNRKFQLDITDSNQIIFKPKRGTRIVLDLPKIRNGYKNILHLLENSANECKTPYSIKLSDDNIFITFDEKIISTTNNIIQNSNRLLSIDMNPSELGYSVLQFKPDGSYDVVESGVFDSHKLTTKLNVSSSNSKQIYQNNKRNFEIVEVSKFLINKCNHFGCSKLVIEDLTMGNENHGIGKNFNRLVNNCWNRLKLIDNLKKRCSICGIKIVSVNCAYSSYVGNIVNSSFPDPISAAIEIGRRGYFQFIKNKFYPELITIETLSNRWKEATEWSYCNWKELCCLVKNSKLKYRVSKESKMVHLVFQKEYHKRMISYYSFI